MILNRVAAWAADLSFTDIPLRLNDLCRLQILSSLAAGAAGATTATGRKLSEVVDRLSWPGSAGLLPDFKRRAAAEVAVLNNATLACVHDYDDYLLMGHTGLSAVFVSLALAQELDRSLGETLTAQVIANESGGRLGASCVLGPLNGQAWTFIHLLGGSLAAAKLMGLPAAKTAHAAALAMYQPPFALWPGFMGPESKSFSAALPAAIGIWATRLADADFTGPVNVLDHPQGFYAQFSYRPFKEMLTGFGQSWVTDTLTFKIYPGCAYIDSAMDALFDLLQRYREAKGHPLDPQRVEKISLECSFLTSSMEKLAAIPTDNERTPININFSVKWNLAIGMAADRLTPAELTEESLSKNREIIEHLLDKIHIEHDVKMSAAVLDYFNSKIEAGKLLGTVSMKDLVPMLVRARASYGESLPFGAEEMKKLVKQLPGLMAQVAQKTPGFMYDISSSGPYNLGDYQLMGVGVPIPIKLSITTSDGWRGNEEKFFPLGSPERPLSETRTLIEEKFLSVSQSAGEARGRKKFIKDLYAADPEIPVNTLLKPLVESL